MFLRVFMCVFVSVGNKCVCSCVLFVSVGNNSVCSCVLFVSVDNNSQSNE